MQTYSFTVSGMSCGNCVKSVSQLLANQASMNNLQIKIQSPQITFSSEETYDANRINQILKSDRYIASPVTKKTSFLSLMLETLALYWPLVLLFLLTALIPAIYTLNENLDFHVWMRLSMGSLLVALSYFKLLDLVKFADGFSTYDPLAMKTRAYGFVYPFLELFSGVLLLLDVAINPVLTAIIIYLGVTTLGVSQALLQKRKFECACLGTLFKLPLTKITLIENGIMIAMAIAMLLSY